MKKSKSSREWIRQHEDDPYVKRARRDGFRSRASYKLLEIDEKYRLLKPGLSIIDLGATPGGWSQVAAARAGEAGLVLALDILPMDPVDGVTFIEGDFAEEGPFEALVAALGGRPADLVISDMAPNLSGMKDIDQPRSAYLVELALDLVDRVLARGGNLVAKCFEGEGIDAIRQAYGERFEKVHNFKPKASRGKSREIYIIGCGHKSEPDV